MIGGRDYPGQQASEIFSNEAYPTPPLNGSDEDLGLGRLDAGRARRPSRRASPGGQTVLDMPHSILRISSVIKTVAGGGSRGPRSAEGGPAVERVGLVPRAAWPRPRTGASTSPIRASSVTSPPTASSTRSPGARRIPSPCDGTWVTRAVARPEPRLGWPGLRLRREGGGGGETDSSPRVRASRACRAPRPRASPRACPSAYPVDVAVGPDGSGLRRRRRRRGLPRLPERHPRRRWQGWAREAVLRRRRPRRRRDGQPDRDRGRRPTARSTSRRASTTAYGASAPRASSRRSPATGPTATRRRRRRRRDRVHRRARRGRRRARRQPLHREQAVRRVLRRPHGMGPPRRRRRHHLRPSPATARGSAYWDTTDFNGRAGTAANILPNRVAVASDGSVYFDTNSACTAWQPTGRSCAWPARRPRRTRATAGWRWTRSLSDVQGLTLGPDGTLFARRPRPRSAAWLPSRPP